MYTVRAMAKFKAHRAMAKAQTLAGHASGGRWTAVPTALTTLIGAFKGDTNKPAKW